MTLSDPEANLKLINVKVELFLHPELVEIFLQMYHFGVDSILHFRMLLKPVRKVLMNCELEICLASCDYVGVIVVL